MIFLSASIPTPGREFYGTEDVVAIREAVMAFTKVCMEKRLPFYFGGHPAITPLVWEVAKDYLRDEFKKLIRIYQSSWFIGKTPKEVDFFSNVIWTDVKETIPESVEYMRNQMFRENNTTIAVFIGGMKGITDEYELITKYYPKVKVLPIATTGAASEKLYKDLGLNNPDFSDNYSYVSVFRKYL
jgi:hypothetical protein